MHALDEAIKETTEAFKNGLNKGQLMQLDFIESNIKFMTSIEDVKKYVLQEKHRLINKEK